MLIMAVLVKWLTHRFVDPTHVGSIPTYRLLLLGYGQAVRQQVLILSCVGSNPASPISRTGFVLLWRYSQVVRQRSAKPLSPVQIRLPPLRLGANLKRSVRCRCGGIGRRAGFKIPFPHGSIGSTPITGIMDYYTSFKSPKDRAFLLSKNKLLSGLKAV